MKVLDIVEPGGTLKRRGPAPAERPLLFGILGGMGPLASAEFLRQLVEYTPAHRDQDHLPVMLRSVPQIPDRTEAIRGHGPSPLPALKEGVRALAAAGVCEIAIPCNTAHYWHADLDPGSQVGIVHICDVVLRRLHERGTPGAKIGILATTGTLESNMYGARLAAHGYGVLQPSEHDQRELVEAGIAATKAGQLERGRDLLRDCAMRLLDAGADLLLLACTEIGVSLGEERNLPSLDAGRALAEYCATRWHGMLLASGPPLTLEEPVQTFASS